MFLKKIEIKNFRLFKDNFILDDFNVPDNNEEGTGLTLIVGENGCGKTTVLDAIGMCMLDYKASSFNVCDLNVPKEESIIVFSSDEEFHVAGSFPNTDFFCNRI